MEEDSVAKIRVSACQECETCPKKERSRIIPVTDDLRNPAIVFMAESPLTVVIKEVKIPNHNYLIFRCQDPMCLLAHSREAINQYWLDDQRRKATTVLQQTKHDQRKYGNKRKRRKKNK